MGTSVYSALKQKWFKCVRYFFFDVTNVEELLSIYWMIQIKKKPKKIVLQI